MFRHATRYTFGSEVFLKLREERRPGIVNQIALNPGNATYQVSWPDGTTSSHYDFELTAEYVQSFVVAPDDDEGGTC